MGTEIDALRKQLEKHGLTITKKRKPKGISDINLLINGAFGGVASRMIKKKVDKLTIRKIIKETIHDKLFIKALDHCFKGEKRKKFNDTTRKQYNTKYTLIQDIYSVGDFNRFKLIERAIKLDMNAVRAMLDPDYRPAGDKVIVRKRKYKKS
jgi:hypothetical protein